ncbi:MAG: glycosyltransferase family 2 protein [Bacteroidota bacterium]
MVSVIIINYNTFNVTCDCIESVIAHTKGVPYEIVLVDNNSPTDNPDDFLLKFPGIKLIKSMENGGFAKGNNIGIREALGDIILLLNSDTILTEDSISISANFLAKDPRIGALGIRTIYPDGKLQPSARKFRSIRNEILDLLRPLLMLMPYRRRASLMLNQYFKGDFNTPCGWVSGAYMMFPAAVLQKLPGKKLDERFFMYGEDELWCYQFQEAGYTNYFLADTTIIHLMNASVEPAKQLRLLKTYIAHEMIVMEYIHGKGIYFHAFRLIFTAKEMLRYYIKVAVYKLFRHRIR